MMAGWREGAVFISGTMACWDFNAQSVSPGLIGARIAEAFRLISRARLNRSNRIGGREGLDEADLQRPLEAVKPGLFIGGRATGTSSLFLFRDHAFAFSSLGRHEDSLTCHDPGLAERDPCGDDYPGAAAMPS
jgi:hypothetical protein